MVPTIMNVNEILKIFAQYGFRKASMEDLARAADMSRQGLYKRFGSKDGLFAWAIESFMQQCLKEAQAELNKEGATAKEALLAAFAVWTGRHVPMLHTTPHGMEVMDRAIAVLLDGSVDVESDFYEKLAQFCAAQKLTAGLEQARELVFALVMASKGLMLKSQTEEAFNQGMERILNVMLVARP